MDWNIRTDLPIYSQLLEQIKVAIVSGGFKPGERLPSVRDMALEAGVNPNTMQRALQELEREGLVYSMRTAGRFVTEDAALIDQARNLLAADSTAAYIGAMRGLGFDGDKILMIMEKTLKEVKHGDS